MAEGCIVHAKSIQRSVVGIRSRIGKKTVVKNTIVFGNDSYQSWEEVTDKDSIPMGIGDNCHIENAILDKGCMIGNNVTIKGTPRLKNKRTDTYCIVEGIIVIKKGAIIPDGTRIGGKV